MRARIASLLLVMAACREPSPPSAPLVAADDPALPRALPEPPDAAVAIEVVDAAPPDPAAVEAAVLRSIREVSPTEHVITERSRTLLVNNRDVLMRSARIVPDRAKGAIGVYGVRPGSILARLGLENGDRVLRVQGQAMSTPEALDQVWVDVSHGNRIDLEIERRGRPLSLVIHVE